MNRTILLLCATWIPAVCIAADPPSTIGSGDEQLIEKLLGGDPAAAPEASSGPAVEEPDTEPAANDLATNTTVERIGADLLEARRLLDERQTGEPTRAAQRRVIDELSRLIEAAKSQPSRSGDGQENSNGRPQSESDGSRNAEPPPGREAPTSDAAGTAAGTPGRNRNGKAEESSDRARQDRLREAVRDFRSDLVRDEWGHLPPRLREQLLNAGSDEYLPQYDSLVRRYFESLAQPAPAPQ